MKKPVWLDQRALVLLHAESLAEHGGLWGLRDEAALQSAMARPRNLHAYEPSADAARLAAAYGFGLVRGHPFSDGNKRAGFLAIGLFLELNGFDFEVDEANAVKTILDLAAGNFSEKALAEWIRARIKRRKRL
ncbi:MAG TPA: type II toxin-antitoxin system death-on-curing family toxin [Terriglobales bacterium]|nr:type II toxin-antitoxin system death-on-curing family toxin [Terriglobales bacterium]